MAATKNYKCNSLSTASIRTKENPTNINGFGFDPLHGLASGEGPRGVRLVRVNVSARRPLLYESSPGARGSAPEQRGASKLELRAWTKNTHCRGQSRIGIPILHITTPRASGLHRNRGLHARSRRNESRRRENPAARATRSRADVVAHIRMSRRTRGGPTQGRRGGRNEAQDEGDNPTATSREMHSHETRFPLHVRKARGVPP